MSKVNTTIFVLAIMLFIFLGIGYLFYKGTNWFISGIDGNNVNSNYTIITKNFYLFNTEQSICINDGYGYKELTTNIDSLNWNNEEIIGYRKSKYFMISVVSKGINYFSSKDSLLKAIDTSHFKTLREVPHIKL